jgi:3-oxoacyl-(acyl-carrier-protein) synthase/acyl carrier protein
VTELAIGSGLDALRDAGIPLVMRYKTTTKGTQLPERWGLPDELRDDTGVIFGSAFPGVDFLASETGRYHTDLARRQRLQELEELRHRLVDVGSSADVLSEVNGRIAAVREEIEADPYTFERRFLLKLLAMGHSQFAELIGARGPNTQINAACATTTQAVGLAEDWIRSGRCRRVVIISGDDVTSDHLLEWMGAGFLASGAAATDESVEEAAIPFDRRRHGLLIGMGAAAIVVESLGAAQERGIQPICEVLASVTANSAFHGTRLDVGHITQVMETLMRQAEERWGIDRFEIAPKTVFISHETYTPARGGSAQAEVYALRDVFGHAADQVVIANTKGYTGHPMAVGIEDVLAIKTLETGLVPPVANFKEVDPDLGNLNLSGGGAYPVQYALRLGAGFGSQISLSLIRWVPTADGQHRPPRDLGYAYRIVDPAAWQSWLGRVSGLEGPEIEVVQRTLRVKDQGPPSREARPVGTEPARPAAPPPVPATAPSAPAVTEPSPPTAAAGQDPVERRVLEIVSETTGYPPDMLDLDLDMEADLGIDTVKQAETFAAIREEWGIPRDDDLQLRDFPTLAHAIQFVYDRRPDLAPGAAGEPPAPTPEPMTTDEEPAGAPDAGEKLIGDMETADSIPRRVPVPVLRPDLENCRATNVTLGRGSRVVVMSDGGGIGKALVDQLTKIGVETLVIDPALEGDGLRQRLAGWRQEGSIKGVYWLPALDEEGFIADISLEGWRQAIDVRVKRLFTTMRELYEEIGRPGTFLVVGTRLGGQHGYDEAGALAPLGGAVVGFAKTFKRERADALVKAVDFGPSRTTTALAKLLMAETLRDPGVVEVGYKAGRRWTVGLVEEPLPTGLDETKW